jgi:hypothetical protein
MPEDGAGKAVVRRIGKAAEEVVPALHPAAPEPPLPAGAEIGEMDEAVLEHAWYFGEKRLIM